MGKRKEHIVTHCTKNNITFRSILMLGMWIFIFNNVKVSVEHYLFLFSAFHWNLW